ncbi:hypothetical protein NDU88_001126 [Pleurodeles waltl]|uniref:Uncharacterized protein n=1 Tax=Pleurodeles waltl TaxID=8319 RepID=A0AAV7LAE1_PLEWA|nr:hypothetical protein NDU88_001126 [Pleurodeles waltl]
MDAMRDRLDKQQTGLMTTEERISSVEDDAVQRSKELSDMQDELRRVCLKNYVCILGISEIYNMGCTEAYIEDLLITLFGANKFSKIFAVARDRCSLDGRPVQAPRLVHHCKALQL